ncbi:hypothetical protein [Staphylococcus simulans]|uniref:hypothetical protein n=1 Tax=Staphylococcus simulans TaxID=1286 RepID=UPI0039999CC8
MMDDEVQFLTDEIRRMQNMLLEMSLNQNLMSIDLKYLGESENRNFESLVNKIDNLDRSLMELKSLIRNNQ